MDHGSEAAEQHGAATAVGTWRPVRRPVRPRSRYRIPVHRAAGWIVFGWISGFWKIVAFQRSRLVRISLDSRQQRRAASKYASINTSLASCRACCVPRPRSTPIQAGTRVHTGSYWWITTNWNPRLACATTRRVHTPPYKRVFLTHFRSAWLPPGAAI